MNDKIRLVVALIIISNIALGIKSAEKNNMNLDKKVSGVTENSIYAGSDDIEIDLLNNTLTSKEGINLKHGDLELKAFDIKRDVEKNRVYVNGKFQTLFINEMGNISLDSQEGGEVSLGGEEGVFYNNFGYIEVGKITGAQKPNDKIYFGGDKIEYKDNKISIKNGWLTTDYGVIDTKDPNRAGYHFLSEDIIIESDKQVTIKNSDFYTGDKSRLPFRFPWYRANIRSGSTVPLFPEWKTDRYYGWNTSWGVLYGDRNDKFVGGFAPRFADKMGLLVGRWENWYRTDRYGTMKLNIDDWLIASKEHSLDKSKLDPLKDAGKIIEHEEKKKRYRVNYSHDYSGEYGKFYFNAINSTYNMVPKLEDVVLDYSNKNKFSNIYSEGTRPDLSKTMSFFSLDSDLSGLGVNKDITFTSKLKLTDDKKAYALMVYDDIDDIPYGVDFDNDLFAQVSLYQDNKDYKVGGYYNYLYDMDPGSSITDNRSRGEDFGFEFLDKDTKVGFSYDERNGDKMRKLELWEKNPKLDKLMNYRGMYGSKFNGEYAPNTIVEYDRFDTKDLRVSFGEYEFYNGYKIKAGYDYNSEIKELNLDNDPLRLSTLEREIAPTYGGLIKNDMRSKQFNRYEDIIYSNKKEHRGYVDIFDDTTKFTFAGGKSKEEFWDRTGIYTSDGYRKFVNESDFYEFSAQKNELSLGAFGEVALFGGVRYDHYTKGYNPYSNNGLGNYTSGNDSTIRTQAKLNHVITLFDNTTDPNRNIDFSMGNDLELFYQRYDYDSGNIKIGDKHDGRDSEYIRLKIKDNIYQVKDTITTEIGNTQTDLSVEYKRAENPATDKVNSEAFGTELEFKVDDNESLVLNYGQDKKYTDETLDNRNYNYYTFRDYGIRYSFDNHTLAYQNNSIDSKIRNIDPYYNYGLDIADSKEKLRLNTYSYEYAFKDYKFGLDYSEGRDKRDAYTPIGTVREIDVKNQIFGMTFVSGGDVENNYRATYEKYDHREEGAKDVLLDNGRRYNIQNSDVISLRYEYKDKRLSDDEIRKYAQLEYNKDASSITPQEIYRMRDILNGREDNYVDFRLNRNIYNDFTNIGDYKRNFRAHLMLHRNDARYERTGDYFSSLEKIEGGLFYSQNRFGIGYEFEENADWREGANNLDKKWAKLDREHKLSLVTRFGKPSEGWLLKTYAKFYEDLTGDIKKSSEERARKSSLDGFGVEIGKEMGYYQWSVAFEKKYVLSARDYEWRAGLQFTLLTFPDMPIFSAGPSGSANGGHISPEVSVFSGIDVEDINN